MTLPAERILAGPATSQGIRLRRPRVTDGKAVHALIAGCPPLDTNSLYLNLLQCAHFAATCVVAEHAGAPSSLLGFTSGYLLPHRPKTLFIWQVAIAESARGRGLARSMLMELIGRPACVDVDQLEATITASNSASWALFGSFARALECPLERRVLFDRDAHLDASHESEMLVTIGPFVRRPASASSTRKN